MGTNYTVQIYTGNNAEGEAEYEDLHIGKSSMGWVFSLRVYPERGIHSLYDWLPILLTGDNDHCSRSQHSSRLVQRRMVDEPS